MSSRFLAAVCAAFLLIPVSAAAQRRDAPVTQRQLVRHIEVLASDGFEGRAPATEGERRTIAYISDQLRRRGVEPGASGGGWYQPVPLVERLAQSHRIDWRANGARLAFDSQRIMLVGRNAQEKLAGAPVVFVGHGVVDRARGIDQLAGADLSGAVALILVEAPGIAGFPSFEERAAAVAAAGAAAVIGIVPDEIPWQSIVERGRSARTELDRAARPALLGAIPAGEIAALVRSSGGDFETLLNEQSGPSFRAVPLNLTVDADVTSEVRRWSSNNVVGRIRGTGDGGESVLLLGHWDHLGLCRPEGEADRICNGAVDNASGIAVLIESAGRLSERRPERDVLILATTAEEIGLFGAEHFAAQPTVPLASIVAAVNLDTVAIHGRGEPVAVIGRGTEPLDRAIAETATTFGRRMDTTYAADSFVRRQDGWALARAGVPAVMVGGAFADIAGLEAFLSSVYHGPGDEARPDLPLGGAAEDADLIVALTRRLADPERYWPPQR